MNLALVVSYIAVVVMLIATPGPVVALVMNTAATSGPRRAFITALGTACASLVLIAAAALIISGAAVLDAETLRWISVAGCLYIAWLAIGTIRRYTRGEAQEDAVALRPGGWLRGLLVGISNPKDILFFVALFPQFIQVTSSFSASIAVLTLIWVVLDMLILGSYILLLGRLLSPRFQRWVALSTSVLLLALATVGLVYNLAG